MLSAIQGQLHFRECSGFLPRKSLSLEESDGAAGSRANEIQQATVIIVEGLEQKGEAG